MKEQYFDFELSFIDQMNYTQAQPPASMPVFLDMYADGQTYRYTPLIANLGEHTISNRMPNAPHKHPVFHIVLYVAGQGVVNLADQLYPVATGSLVITPPNIPHSFTPAGGSVAYHALTFALCKEEEHLLIDADVLFSYYLGKPVTIPLVSKPNAAAYARLRHRMERIVKHLQAQPIDWLQHQQHMISLFSLISNLGSISSNTDPDRIEHAQNLIESRFADPALTLQTLAAELQTSPEHLCRQFRRITGCSPIQYRNRLRTQAATALLRNTNLSAKAIAERLGYSDLYTFSKAYRRATGYPPNLNRSLEH